MSKSNDVYSNSGEYDLVLPISKIKNSEITRDEAVAIFNKYKLLALSVVNKKYPKLSADFKNDSLIILWNLVLSIGTKLTPYIVYSRVWSGMGTKFRKRKCELHNIDDCLEIESSKNQYSDIENRDYLEKLIKISGIKKRNITRLKMRMLGYEYSEIGKIYGTDKHCLVVNNMRTLNKLKKHTKLILD